MDLDFWKPNVENSTKLDGKVSLATKNSFIKLLEVAENGLGNDLRNEILKIKSVDVLYLSPKFYFLYDRLKDGIVNQSEEKVLIALDYLKSTKIKELFNSYDSIPFYILGKDSWVEKCIKIGAENSENDYDYDVKDDSFLNYSIEKTLSVISDIEKFYPTLYAEMKCYMKAILLSVGSKIKGPLGYPLFGSTSFSYHKAIFMQLPYDYPCLEGLIFEHLVHECAHIHLNATLVFSSLLENDESERYISSVRKDPRPLIGIYHSMFVSLRVIDAMNHMPDIYDSSYMKKQIKIVQNQFNGAFICLQKNAIFTSYGRQLFESCRPYYKESAIGFIE